jgi:hypothetical protein
VIRVRLSLSLGLWRNTVPGLPGDEGEGAVDGPGRIEGAEAILIVFEARSLDVSEAERDRITSCANLRQLKNWIKRAVTVEKAAGLFA